MVTLSASAYRGSFDSEQYVFKNNSIAEFRKTHKLKTYLSTCPNDILKFILHTSPVILLLDLEIIEQKFFLRQSFRISLQINILKVPKDSSMAGNIALTSFITGIFGSPGTWGPFLESPGNSSGPKSNIQIEI